MLSIQYKNQIQNKVAHSGSPNSGLPHTISLCTLCAKECMRTLTINKCHSYGCAANVHTQKAKAKQRSICKLAAKEATQSMLLLFYTNPRLPSRIGKRTQRFKLILAEFHDIEKKFDYTHSKTA